MTGICIPNGMINERAIQNLVLEKELRLLIRTPEEYLFCKEHLILKGCMTEIESYKHRHRELVLYVDEPISTPEYWKPTESIYSDTVFGELTKKAFKRLHELNPEASLTYTSYKEWWFTLFGYRIYKWWKDQRGVWDWMFTNGLAPKVVWVLPDQKELMDYAKLRKVDCFVYTEETDVDKLVKQLEAL